MKLKYKGLIILLFSFFFVSHSYSQTETARDSVIQFASKYLKVPYKRGGSTPKAFDCSGFTSFVYRNFGYNLYRTADGQIKNASTVIVDKSELKQGDLVFFKGRNAKQNRIGHVGIVFNVSEDGSFRFIHASCKYGVTVTCGQKNYYTTRFVAAGRILEERPLPLEPLPINMIEIQALKPLRALKAIMHFKED